MFFYNNKIKGPPASNPWETNLTKFILPKVFVEACLIKDLIKAYNPITYSFHRKDRGILCTLDRVIFIEAFRLQ